MTSSTPTPYNFAKPSSITGGCLCGSILYKIEFPKDHDFLKSSGSCQCTQCRRNSGTLVSYAHVIRFKDITFLTPTSTLKNFKATEKLQRGICTNCGSFLYWRDESTDQLQLAVGTVDPEYLIGENGEHGYGFALANCLGSNIFCENEIKGVNEGFIGNRGKRWATTETEGVRAKL